MKKVLMAVVIMGLSGGVYAGTAAEQLGVNLDAPAMAVPAVGVASAVSLKAVVPTAEKLATMKNMFDTGKKVTYQQLESFLSKNIDGLLMGSFVSNVLGSAKESERIVISCREITDGAAGPLWPPQIVGYNVWVEFMNREIYEEVWYGLKTSTQPSDEVTNLGMNANHSNDSGSLNIELRRSGNYMVGRMNGNYKFWNKSDVPSKSGDAYFYMWQN